MSNNDLSDTPITEEEIEIECCQAVTIEDQIGRLQMVTERYEIEHYLDGIRTVQMNDVTPETLLSKEGFDTLRSRLSPEEDESFMKDGILVEQNGKKIYLDKYNWNSVPFVVKQREEYLGSARLIIKNGFGLPTTNDPRIEISHLWKEKADQSPAEFSQFAVKKGAPMDTSVRLLKAAYDYSNYAGIKNWVATTDNSVVRLLNSSFFKFDLPYIGPSVDYLGSASTPIYIDLEKALSNASQFESSKRMAQFIRGI